YTMRASTRGTYLASKVEARINPSGQIAAGAFGLLPLRVGQCRIAREGARHRLRIGGCRHDRGQEARMKPEFAVEPDMLGALCKGEQPGMADTPSIQLIAGCADEKLPNAGVPQIGSRRQRTEKADAAPARCEI